jgi:hypothetical protein
LSSRESAFMNSVTVWPLEARFLLLKLSLRVFVAAHQGQRQLTFSRRRMKKVNLRRELYKIVVMRSRYMQMSSPTKNSLRVHAGPCFSYRSQKGRRLFAICFIPQNCYREPSWALLKSYIIPLIPLMGYVLNAATVLDVQTCPVLFHSMF